MSQFIRVKDDTYINLNNVAYADVRQRGERAYIQFWFMDCCGAGGQSFKTELFNTDQEAHQYLQDNLEMAAPHPLTMENEH